ncbi:MAG: hypothetical protein HKN43_03100 [Rhodothermales bacterium]|nr:hypothetical protein [Rhodothermales bacterium]
MDNIQLAFVAAFAVLLIAAIGCDEQPTAANIQAGETVSSATLAKHGGNAGQLLDFADAEAFFEFNTTDNDLGLQIFLDAVGWNGIRIEDANNEQIVEVRATGPLADLGITELRFESAEPSPEAVLANFPPGEYLFTGRTPEGDRLVGDSELSHNFAPPPTITPSDGLEVDVENTVVEWDAPGAELVEIIIESEDSDAVFDIIVEAEVTSLNVPPQFLEAGTEYKLEILAYAENGNRTIVETSFVTADE